MPKIFIRGEHEPVVVAIEDADRILNQRNNPSYKGMIDVGTRKVQKSAIKEVRYEESSTTHKYNIEVPSDREIIKEFEKWLDSLKDNNILHPLEYYGRPFPDQKKFSGYVSNELFGGVHCSLVAWALENKIISKNGERWGIVVHGDLDISAYTDILRKLEALTELRGRRQYAEKREIQSIEKTVEENNINPNDIPF